MWYFTFDEIGCLPDYPCSLCEMHCARHAAWLKIAAKQPIAVGECPFADTCLSYENCNHEDCADWIICDKGARSEIDYCVTGHRSG